MENAEAGAHDRFGVSIMEGGGYADAGGTKAEASHQGKLVKDSI